jgi:YbbR domain-containing protein
MLKNPPINRAFLENLLWFLGALALAFFVWVIAVSQSDPIVERRLPGVRVQIITDEGLLVTNDPRDTVTVTVRGQRSVLDLLTADDILVQADLTGLPAGEHTVELEAGVAPGRNARVVDTSPRQLPVVLEMVAQRFVPVRALITEEPPPGFQYETPVFDIAQNQVLVSGPQSKVDQVAEARVELGLGERRNPLELDTSLTPVDVNGSVVTGVTLEPQVVHVEVDIQRRNDVREVRVSPNILVDTIPSGYVLTSVSYEPQEVLIGGSPDRMDSIPDTVSTAPIDLTNHTQDFEITVPVVLPDESLLLVGNQSITVSIGIEARTANRQFDRVPVEITGLPENYSVQIAPDEVTVLVTGPQPLLEALSLADIHVTVDLNGLSEGNYQLEPQVTVNGGDTLAVSTSVLPAEVDVQITPPTDGR